MSSERTAREKTNRPHKDGETTQLWQVAVASRRKTKAMRMLRSHDTPVVDADEERLKRASRVPTTRIRPHHKSVVPP